MQGILIFVISFIKVRYKVVEYLFLICSIKYIKTATNERTMKIDKQIHLLWTIEVT